VNAKFKLCSLTGVIFLLLIISGFQIVNAGSIIRLTRSPDRNQYDASEIVIVDCEMDLDGTTRWFVENLSTGQNWYKHRHGSKVNQERLVLSELVNLGNGNQTIKVTCEGRYGDGGWTGGNVARRSMQFSVDSGTTTSEPIINSGGMNFEGYCEHLGYDRARAGNQSNAFTWVCQDGNRETGLDLSALCRWQYDGALPNPGLDDPYNPSDWACYRNSHRVAQMPPPAPSNNPTVVDPPVVVNPPNPGNGNNSDCPNHSSRLSVGQIAVVDVNYNSDLKVRTNPGTGSSTRDNIYRGNQVTIIGGPQCVGNYRWWEIGYNGKSGWSAEVGAQGEYYLIPNGQALQSETGSSPGGDSSGVSGGTTSGGIITSSSTGRSPQMNRSIEVVHSPSFDRLNFRRNPNLNSGIIRELREGEVGTVVDGPRQADGYTWWQVRIGNTTGWIAQGYQGENWIVDAGSSSNGGGSVTNTKSTSSVNSGGTSGGNNTGTSGTTSNKEESNNNSSVIDSEFDTDTWDSCNSGTCVQFSLSEQYRHKQGSWHELERISLVFNFMDGGGHFCYIHGTLEVIDSRGSVIWSDGVIINYITSNTTEYRIDATPMIDVQLDTLVKGYIDWACGFTNIFTLNSATNGVDPDMPSTPAQVRGDGPRGNDSGYLTIPNYFR
jgi:uncharacterized protein YraI